MATNHYFNNYGSLPEQRVIEDLIVESIKIMGFEAYYLPNDNDQARDLLFSEDPVKKFESAFSIEMYLSNSTEYLGEKEFFSKFYEQEIEVKYTPDFFPFVEPGGMMSLTCVLCKGKGCDVCKGTGWLEIMGCGMIHPKVLEMAGIDSKTYSGFAWGFGIERLVMLKYNINDVRLFNNGNLEFIKEF